MVKDPEVKYFIEKCLATVSLRVSAHELLDDPFFRIDDGEFDLRSVDVDYPVMPPLVRQPHHHLADYYNYPSNSSSLNRQYSNGYHEYQNRWAYNPGETEETHGIELFECRNENDQEEDKSSGNVDISIKGKRRDDGGLFLRLRITDKEGNNSHFNCSQLVRPSWTIIFWIITGPSTMHNSLFAKTVKLYFSP